MSKFTLTKEQQDYINFLKNGSGHTVLKAVAGSGKTSTLLAGLDHMSGNTALCAYNRAIADEIKGKIGFRPGIFANTLHGYGLAAWKKLNPAAVVDEDAKIKEIRSHVDSDLVSFISSLGYTQEQIKSEADKVFSLARKLLSFAKQEVFGVLKRSDDKQSWLDIFERNDLISGLEDSDGNLHKYWSDYRDQSFRIAYKALKYSISISDRLIDHDDMIYMPLIKNIPMYRYSWVLLDEAQDTNPARRLLAKRMLKRDGRLIAVGDDKQAIYGFTGATANSIDLIKQDLNAITLSLSVSFRCSKAVVRAAQEYNPDIQYADNAVEGSDTAIDINEFCKIAKNISPDNAIICRNTAPLVDLAYYLLSIGKACHIEGRKIGENLAKMVDQWKAPKTVGAYLTRLDKYADDQTAKYGNNPDKLSKLDQLLDQIAAIKAIASGLDLSSPREALKDKIMSLFADNAPSLTLTTIHKSKGREFNQVYWIGCNRYNPSSFAKLDWQIDQESNLCYVAITRAKIDLIRVIVPLKGNVFGKE